MLKKLKLLGFCFALMCVFASFGDMGILKGQTIDFHAEVVGPVYPDIGPTDGRIWNAKVGTKYTKGEAVYTNERDAINNYGREVRIRDYYIVKQDFVANGDATWITAGSLFQFDATYQVAYLIPGPIY
ncbi:MAG: hypothetical protein ACRCUP_05265 [Mycoplasmatales bacterium]